MRPYKVYENVFSVAQFLHAKVTGGNFFSTFYYEYTQEFFFVFEEFSGNYKD